MNATQIRVIQSIYALSDDIDYNLYDSEDIAEYANLDKNVVQETIKELFHEGYLGECMSYEDDGIETYHLMERSLRFVEA
ncbi:MAG: hypothetical protein JXK05_05945 [Campylobacterales bacterium]|nr:hypothetical protein [Campylobacterales bacterium]